MNYIKYLGIRHDYQGTNCMGLLADFYENELNISLSIERDTFNNFYLESRRDLINVPLERVCNMSNWITINLTELQEFDIIVYTKKCRLSHFAMYVGNYRILHLPEGTISQISDFNDERRKNIAGCFRHKQLATAVPELTV